jgi:phosphate-selective porin OprO/OprP
MEEHRMFTRSFGSRRLASLALVATLITIPGPARAGQRSEPSRAELEDRIRRLERIIQERGLDQPPGKAPAMAPSPAPLEQSQVESIVDDKLKKQKVLAGWNDGFFLQSPNGDFKLKIGGYLQADTRFMPFEKGQTTFDNFYLRRVRSILQGTVYKYFDFKLMPDFGDGKTVLQDAYMDVNYVPYAKFRSGKFKVPLSIERLQSGSDLLFVERSIANNLAPNRDVGFQLFGDTLGGALGYQAGVFDGTTDGGSNDGDTTSDKELGGRAFVQPFTNTSWTYAKGFGLGIAGTYGGQRQGDSESGVAYKTPGRATFFKFVNSKTQSVVANGNRSRVAPQAYYFWGPLGIMGEYINDEQGLRLSTTTTKAKVTTTKITDDSIDNSGWFVQASYVLTGENASYKGVTPINPFDPRQGRWGAFELAARGSEVNISPAAFDEGFATRPDAAGSATEWTGGINWYLNKSFKFQLNYEHTDFDKPTQFGAKTLDHEDVVLTRFQLQF